MNQDLLADHWQRPPDRIELGEDEAHIWRASLDQDSATLARLLTLLAPDERSRAKRYYREVDRDHFIVARGILRKILSCYLPTPPAHLQFTYNEYGKPSPSSDQNDRNLNFNLSHANQLVLYAVTSGRRVGIDIEFIREDFASVEIAEHFFSEDEVRALKSLPVDQRTLAFFNCWSRKEAFIKALGMGVSYPLHRFAVSLGPGETPALLKVELDEREPARWKMDELKPGAGYTAAVVIEHPPVFLRQWRWDE